MNFVKINSSNKRGMIIIIIHVVWRRKGVWENCYNYNNNTQYSTVILFWLMNVNCVPIKRSHVDVTSRICALFIDGPTRGFIYSRSPDRPSAANKTRILKNLRCCDVFFLNDVEHQEFLSLFHCHFDDSLKQRMVNSIRSCVLAGSWTRLLWPVSRLLLL